MVDEATVTRREHLSSQDRLQQVANECFRTKEELRNEWRAAIDSEPVASMVVPAALQATGRDTISVAMFHLSETNFEQPGSFDLVQAYESVFGRSPGTQSQEAPRFLALMEQLAAHDFYRQAPRGFFHGEKAYELTDRIRTAMAVLGEMTGSRVGQNDGFHRGDLGWFLDNDQVDKIISLIQDSVNTDHTRKELREKQLAAIQQELEVVSEADIAKLRIVFEYFTEGSRAYTNLKHMDKVGLVSEHGALWPQLIHKPVDIFFAETVGAELEDRYRYLAVSRDAVQTLHMPDSASADFMAHVAANYFETRHNKDHQVDQDSVFDDLWLKLGIAKKVGKFTRLLGGSIGNVDITDQGRGWLDMLSPARLITALTSKQN